MAIVGFLIAIALFFYFKRRLSDTREQSRLDQQGATYACHPANWSEEWHRHWAEKFRRQAERRVGHLDHYTARKRRRLIRRAERLGLSLVDAAARQPSSPRQVPRNGEAELTRRARRRARAEAGYYTHLLTYLGAVAFLALINILTMSYPWFLWPALAWGIGLFAHYMALFGSSLVRERYFNPAVERRVRREKLVMHSEKQASIDELSASIAHEIRNPIAAAKSLVQQIGEDPSAEANAEYAEVAVAELDRVERRISHLLKYAKEEDYNFGRIDLAATVNSAHEQMQARLEAANVTVVRNYLAEPAVLADGEKLRQVFANIIGNAIDALGSVPEGRRIELLIENGANRATVRFRDNGCGIPASQIDRVFNPFFTTKEEGTGLGMAISKKIIEDHDGTIDVMSDYGRGAEFVVTLPLHK
jgi:signal transduction histidine kinase